MDYASRLGSDCSFFIQDQPMMGSGRGEVLTPCSVNLKEKWIVLIKPDVHVSTVDAYAGVVPKDNGQNLQSILENNSWSDWKSLVENDFEQSVFKKYPSIRDVKEKLYSLGAGYACMSGSGSTVFGIFNSQVDAAKTFPGLTSWSGQL
jgi:4-diphosphocytidyl-2-C-methyl-D-erythritol kinase